ncbi:hypothetical protein [Kutzneria buriramensis]|uniref:TetR family transcriptional regulator n=1 Tax=Kutzneria buriramensis TaxID=1045776 RepID=A0A3E0GTK8_9PSEU|nr:hypothetical protein [Kutzneria buriramensis]REH27064.1 hypothetical protein BCF44_13035 [Kutzneria buriramensis]
MSWNDYYRRRDVIDAVLAHPGAIGETFTQVPDAAAVFADTDELLLALDHKWTQQLTARIGLALSEIDRPDTEGDRVDAVSAAWRRAVAENPALRRILDENSGGVLADATAREHRMLALAAGLAEFTEPNEVLERVGGAFAALLRGRVPAAA